VIGIKMARLLALADSSEEGWGFRSTSYEKKKKEKYERTGTEPYNFHNFGLIRFTMYVNGKQIPFESLAMDTGHKKTPDGLGLQNALRRPGHTSFEHGFPDHTRHIHNRIFRVTLGRDSRPKPFRWPHVSLGER